MNELSLKYGCNPNQKPSRIFMKNGGELPVEVLNGKPGYMSSRRLQAFPRLLPSSTSALRALLLLQSFPTHSRRFTL